MIREERDPDFWLDVARHPAVAPLLGPISPDQMALLVTSPLSRPLAAKHGGYVFIQRDEAGRVLELHSLFTPEGWGREASAAGKAALAVVFGAGAHLIFTMALAANDLSRPPTSYGFRPIGDFEESPRGSARTWFLTRDAWFGSAAGRRASCH